MDRPRRYDPGDSRFSSTVTSLNHSPQRIRLTSPNIGGSVISPNIRGVISPTNMVVVSPNKQSPNRRTAPPGYAGAMLGRGMMPSPNSTISPDRSHLNRTQSPTRTNPLDRTQSPTKSNVVSSSRDDQSGASPSDYKRPSRITERILGRMMFSGGKVNNMAGDTIVSGRPSYESYVLKSGQVVSMNPCEYDMNVVASYGVTPEGNNTVVLNTIPPKGQKHEIIADMVDSDRSASDSIPTLKADSSSSAPTEKISDKGCGNFHQSDLSSSLTYKEESSVTHKDSSLTLKADSSLTQREESSATCKDESSVTHRVETSATHNANESSISQVEHQYPPNYETISHSLKRKKSHTSGNVRDIDPGHHDRVDTIEEESDTFDRHLEQGSDSVEGEIEQEIRALQDEIKKIRDDIAAEQVCVQSVQKQASAHIANTKPSAMTSQTVDKSSQNAHKSPPEQTKDSLGEFVDENSSSSSRNRKPRKFEFRLDDSPASFSEKDIIANACEKPAKTNGSNSYEKTENNVKSYEKPKSPFRMALASPGMPWVTLRRELDELKKISGANRPRKSPQALSPWRTSPPKTLRSPPKASPSELVGAGGDAPDLLPPIVVDSAAANSQSQNTVAKVSIAGSSLPKSSPTGSVVSRGMVPGSATTVGRDAPEVRLSPKMQSKVERTSPQAIRPRSPFAALTTGDVLLQKNEKIEKLQQQKTASSGMSSPQVEPTIQKNPANKNSASLICPPSIGTQIVKRPGLDSHVQFEMKKHTIHKSSTLANSCPISQAKGSIHSRKHSPMSRANAEKKGTSPSSRRGTSPSGQRGTSPSTRRGLSPPTRRTFSPVLRPSAEEANLHEAYRPKESDVSSSSCRPNSYDATKSPKEPPIRVVSPMRGSNVGSPIRVVSPTRSNNTMSPSRLNGLVVSPTRSASSPSRGKGGLRPADNDLLGYEELQDMAEKLAEELRLSNGSRRALNRDHFQLKEDFEELKKKNSDLQSNLKNMEKECTVSNQERSQLDKACKNLKREYGNLERKHLNLLSDYTDLVKEKADVVRDYEELKKGVDQKHCEKNRQIAQLRVEKAKRIKAEKDCKKMAEENEELRFKLARFEEENNYLKKSIANENHLVGRRSGGNTHGSSHLAVRDSNEANHFVGRDSDLLKRDSGVKRESARHHNVLESSAKKSCKEENSVLGPSSDTHSTPLLPVRSSPLLFMKSGLIIEKPTPTSSPQNSLDDNRSVCLKDTTATIPKNRVVVSKPLSSPMEDELGKTNDTRVTRDDPYVSGVYPLSNSISSRAFQKKTTSKLSHDVNNKKTVDVSNKSKDTKPDSKLTTTKEPFSDDQFPSDDEEPEILSAEHF